MLKEFKWMMYCTLVVISVISIGLSSCEKEEPTTPTIVENPLESDAYYIFGYVTEQGKSLEGVTISTSGIATKSDANGVFILKLPNPQKHYSVSFSKGGYLSKFANVEFEQDAKNLSCVALTQELTQKELPIHIASDIITQITKENSLKTVLTIPSGAINKPMNISFTECLEGYKTNSTHSSWFTLNCEPTGFTLLKPAQSK